MSLMIGLTGLRGVGKSEITKILVKRHNFCSAHIFGPGKAMCLTYYTYLGIDKETAWRMVHGDLKDVPQPLLPYGSTSRHFMENFGRFMGQNMGPAWTMGVELDHLRAHHPGKRIVFESVVYEADYLRYRGGVIFRVERPGIKPIVGEASDTAQAAIAADETIVNDGSLTDLENTLSQLFSKES